VSDDKNTPGLSAESIGLQALKIGKLDSPPPMPVATARPGVIDRRIAEKRSAKALEIARLAAVLLSPTPSGAVYFSIVDAVQRARDLLAEAERTEP
jgi:hypothetical protein